MAAIYVIRNKFNNFVYVGCTAGKLAKRLREHKCLLNQKRHTSVKMQSDWDEIGPGSFEIVAVETLPEMASVVTKRVRELYWMQHYSNTLYNAFQNSFAPTPEAIRKGIEASRTVKGNRWTSEANKKRSDAQKGIPKGHGAKISATKKANKLLRTI